MPILFNKISFKSYFIAFRAGFQFLSPSEAVRGWPTICVTGKPKRTRTECTGVKPCPRRRGPRRAGLSPHAPCPARERGRRPTAWRRGREAPVRVPSSPASGLQRRLGLPRAQRILLKLGLVTRGVCMSKMVILCFLFLKDRNHLIYWAFIVEYNKKWGCEAGPEAVRHPACLVHYVTSSHVPGGSPGVAAPRAARVHGQRGWKAGPARSLKRLRRRDPGSAGLRRGLVEATAGSRSARAPGRAGRSQKLSPRGRVVLGVPGLNADLGSLDICKDRQWGRTEGV